MKTTIVLVAALQGLLIVPALLFKKVKNKPPQIYLGVLVFFFALEMLFYWGGLSGYNNSSGAVPYWLMRSYLFIPPALWLFFRHQLSAQYRFSFKHMLLFLPAIVEIVVSCSDHLSRGNFLRGYRQHWIMITDSLPLLATLAVLGVTSQDLWRRFSQASSIKDSLAWKLVCVWTLFVLMALIWVMESFFRTDLQLLFQVVTSTTLFSLAYLLYFDPSFFEAPVPLPQRQPLVFQGYDDTVQLARLTKIFEEEGIHRRPKLTLAQLAAELNLPVKYTSHLIARLPGGNFIDVVNRYRVQEVISRIPAERHKTLVGIALDAGFSSKSTFQQVFKQHTGKTPSEFLPGTSGIAVSDV